MILSYGEWKDQSKSELISVEHIDTATARYIEPLLSGYINAPIAISERGEQLESKTTLFDNIEDLHDYVHLQVRKGYRVYLYTIIYRPPMPFITMMDETTFEEVELDEVVMSKAQWKLRCTII